MAYAAPALNDSVLINDEKWEVSNVYNSSMHSGNWKAHWENNSGRYWPATCQIKGCGEDAAVGGHMYIKGKLAKYNFILPICYACNNNRDMDYDHEKTNWRPAKANALFVPVKAHEETFEKHKASPPSRGPQAVGGGGKGGGGGRGGGVDCSRCRAKKCHAYKDSDHKLCETAVDRKFCGKHSGWTGDRFGC